MSRGTASSRAGISGTTRRTHEVPASIMAPRLVLIGSVAILTVLGFVMVYSASSIEAYAQYGDAAYFIKRQFVFLIGGIAICAIFSAYPYRSWRGIPAWAFWCVIVGLLAATTLFGFVGLGSKRWLYIGSMGFQPSEFAKVAMLVLAAHLFVLQREGEYAGSFRQFAMTILLVVGLPAAIIFLQPDLGTFALVLFGILAVMWFGEVPMRAVGGIVLAVGIIAVLAIVFVEFRGNRLSGWLDPWSDPLGDGYQTINSFYAFSDGGVFGVGLGNSLQKYLYLPEAYNDFIFAIIGEELGLLGCLAIIALFIALFVASIKIGQRAPDMFGAVLAPSCGALIVGQALLNICCVLGILPVTGKPLPFISYGGTSLITSFMLVGLILSVSFHSEALTSEKRRDSLLVATGGKGTDDGSARATRSRRDGGGSLPSSHDSRSNKRLETGRSDRGASDTTRSGSSSTRSSNRRTGSKSDTGHSRAGARDASSKARTSKQHDAPTGAVGASRRRRTDEDRARRARRDKGRNEGRR